MASHIQDDEPRSIPGLDEEESRKVAELIQVL